MRTEKVCKIKMSLKTVLNAYVKRLLQHRLLLVGEKIFSLEEFVCAEDTQSRENELPGRFSWCWLPEVKWWWCFTVKVYFSVQINSNVTCMFDLIR